jgi:hypothetical protein
VRRAAFAAASLAALVAAAAGQGAWSSAATGNGATGAKTMASSTGKVPTGSVSSHAVTLSWGSSQFADGQNVPAYVLKRYDAITNVLQTTLAGCSGLVAATGCTENGVPTGSWKYTITPAAGMWRGVEGAKSATILVLL